MSQSAVNDLTGRHQEFKKVYQKYKALGLSLDMTRGKPSAQQLDLSNDLLSLPGHDYADASGTDTRNYGGLDGLPVTAGATNEVLLHNEHYIINYDKDLKVPIWTAHRLPSRCD